MSGTGVKREIDEHDARIINAIRQMQAQDASSFRNDESKRSLGNTLHQNFAKKLKTISPIPSTNTASVPAASQLVTTVPKFSGSPTSEKQGGSRVGRPTRHYGIMNAVRLVNLMRVSNMTSILLLDCRDHESYNNKRLKFSLNVPASTNGIDKIYNGRFVLLVKVLISWSTVHCSDVTKSCFGTKREILKYLMDCRQSLIGYLNAPGYYTDIIIYDDSSAPKSLPVTLRTFIKAMVQWNLGTGTKTWILDGGFNALEIPEVNFEKDIPPLALKFPVSVQEFEQYLTMGNDQHPPPNAASDNTKSKAGLEKYIVNLDSAYQKVLLITICKRQLKSLQALKSELRREQLEQRKSVYERTIPAHAKCPVCTQVFSGEIFQCFKGHVVCSKCSEKSQECHECKVPYNKGSEGKIRNLILEKMIESTLKINCANRSLGCKEKLPFARLDEHMKICDEKTRALEVQQIEWYQNAIDKEVAAASRQLQVAIREKVEVELKWYTSNAVGMLSVKREMVDEIVAKRNRLHKAKLALEEEMLVW